MGFAVVMKEIIITSQQQKTYAYNLIKEMPIDGTCLVITKKVDKKLTTRQRALWFVWCKDVSMSGLGAHDTTAGVHEAAKWRIVRLILRRDDEVFAIIYEKFMETVTGSAVYSEYCRQFARDYISTEKLNRKQRAESLTEFKKYWLNKGVNLTINEDLDKKLLEAR
jgi:hypothetical protein